MTCILSINIYVFAKRRQRYYFFSTRAREKSKKVHFLERKRFRKQRSGSENWVNETFARPLAKAKQTTATRRTTAVHRTTIERGRTTIETIFRSQSIVLRAARVPKWQLSNHTNRCVEHTANHRRAQNDNRELRGAAQGLRFVYQHFRRRFEVPPFCWTGLVNIVNSMHVSWHVVHVILSILDRTHIKTQFDAIIIIVPNVFCQSFQKVLLITKLIHIIKLIL